MCLFADIILETRLLLPPIKQPYISTYNRTCRISSYGYWSCHVFITKKSWSKIYNSCKFYNITKIGISRKSGE